MKITHQTAFLALLASCAAIGAPRATQAPAAHGLPRYGMAVYSDLCVNPESGDFGGQRVTVQRFAEVDTVIYEFTAGGLSWPIVASEVNIDPRGSRLYFTVEPQNGEARTISGKLADHGDTLILDGYCGERAVPMALKKVKDFGRAMGACKPCPAGTQAEPGTQPAEPASAAPEGAHPAQQGADPGRASGALIEPAPPGRSSGAFPASHPA